MGIVYSAPKKPQNSALKPTSDGGLAAGVAVLHTEAQALKDLADQLDGTFEAAVDAMFGASGRVIVSGLGKSGHVARKIAATLASTGTPAQHIHPSEASHGDLGMITSNDVVLLLSNSGENQELSDLINYTRRMSIPLIGISGDPSSSLIEASDIGLLLADAPEACPMGLAPTTSSTMMTALGDALAVALMNRRGFSVDDYKVLHPGGKLRELAKLGQSLQRVSDIMHEGAALPLVTGDVPVKNLLSTLTEKRYGCAGILNEAGGLVGVFTDGDLGRHLDADLFKRTAFEVMTQNPKIIRASALVSEAIGLMEQHKITCLFVVTDKEAGTAIPQPIGIVHMHDCLQAGYR